ncbi:MAG: hypothetical protein GOMPHAMPRED_000220 [Gomphillus americanus]|uniref:Uncharacterized protein n=1 Tax=Gomphillus americanus TaxID=1940652 RepID=A0A8H3I3P0_9LECA|nr:MAG: hypothetical protein GOMPHAMPRED_000220 [Gomphillus americanus]
MAAASGSEKDQWNSQAQENQYHSQQGFSQHPQQGPQAQQNQYHSQQAFQQQHPHQAHHHQQQQQQQQQQAQPQIPPLSPVPAPGVYCLPQCIAHQTTSLILRDRMFSFGGDSEIFGTDGSLMFVVKGAVMSMSQRKEVFDSRGQHLFTVRAEVFSIPASYYCETPDGKRFMDVRGKWTFLKAKSEVVFINNGDGKEVKIDLKDNYTNTHAEIKLDNGHVVACIDRDFWSGRNLLGANQYMLTIAPGMDIALCVAMCLAMDERMKQRNN